VRDGRTLSLRGNRGRGVSGCDGLPRNQRVGLRRVARGDQGNRLRAYATLLRVPNLFSAPPDVILGGALVAATAESVSLPTLSGLCMASVLLYAGGVVLNDYFDAPVD